MVVNTSFCYYVFLMSLTVPIQERKWGRVPGMDLPRCQCTETRPWAGGGETLKIRE